MKILPFLLTAFCLSAALTQPALAAGKPIICVMDFEDKSSHSSSWRNVGKGISEMMVTALSETGNYTIVERDQLEKVMSEQRLGASGAVTPQTAAKLGRLLGASYIITGAVTEFGIKDSKLGVGGLDKVLPFGGGAKLATNKARVVIDARAMDTTSGQIVSSSKGQGEKSSAEISGNLSIAPSFDFGKDGFDETIIGKAARKAVDSVTKELTARFTASVGGSVKIVKISGNQLYINNGAANGEKAGKVYSIYRLEEEMIDPDTGESLGAEEVRIGTARVVKVNPKFSIAETKASGVQKTDILRD